VTTKANPMTTDGLGNAPFYAANGRYQITVSGSKVVTTTKTDIQLFDPAEGAAASDIGYMPAGTGAVATTVETKLREALDAVNDFGVDNTGATNCTTQLLAFYNACIARVNGGDGGPGYIRAGTYKITPGVLKFNNAGAPLNWPHIYTDDYTATIFTVDTTTNVNSPLIEWTSVSSNGDHGASWPGNAYWYGGSHGGVTFEDNTSDTAANRDAISLTACWAIDFGYMKGDTLRASTLSVHVDIVRAIRCETGVWFGIGSGCSIGSASIGSCAGWAFDDGTQSGGYSFNRLTVHDLELDDVENGIRLNKGSEFTFDKLRFIHRWNGSALNTSGLYWPRVCIDLTNGTSPNIHIGRFTDVINRIESGGVLANLGVFLNAHSSANAIDVEIEADIVDNASLGVADTWLSDGANVTWNSMSFLVSRKGKKLIDSRSKSNSFATGTAAATTVPNAGFGTSAAKINMVAQRASSVFTSFDLTTDIFTFPRDGLYSISAAIPLTTAVGTKIRLAVMNDTTTELRTEYYSVNAAVQTYNLVGLVKGLQGKQMYLMADQNTGTAALAVTINSDNSECRFCVTEL
jgi:hypothetical protein